MKNMLDFMFCCDINYGDICFVNEITETMVFTLVLTMSIGLIVDTIQSLSVRIIVDIHILW